MSQKVSRKSAINEEKSKAESPVKDMKKKMAANAEKEKQATEKAEKSAEKAAEKAADKSGKADKSDKNVDKKSEKDNIEKKSDKSEPQQDKNKEESTKEDKDGKSEKEKPDQKKGEPSKQKQNGRDRVHNGTDLPLGNGTDDRHNGTVSPDSEDDDGMLIIDDHDELFPELKYDDTSDLECFEPPTPESVPSRSFTRRSQVKATRTPETPRPASDKQPEGADDPKEAKVLKLKEDIPPTDRKLRSADSPKPQEKKQDPEKKQEAEQKSDADKKHDAEKKEDADKKQDGGKKEELNKEEANQKQDSSKKDKHEKLNDGQDKEADTKNVAEKNTGENKSQEEKIEVEIIVDVEINDGDEIQRKTDTNYSKSRVKVSPYRRSMRIADQTNTSVLANYTGNNTTMEMDITESSSFMEEANLDDSSYLRGLRSIRGRSSYKPLKEITLKHVTNRSLRSNTSANLSSAEINRPTGTVVGRKRKPDSTEGEVGTDVISSDVCGDSVPIAGGSKRMRVLERLTEPFRRVASVSLPSTHRRNADIVGINTDLPLTAPVVAETFAPESLKTTTPLSEIPIAVPLPTREENKRCVLM